MINQYLYDVACGELAIARFLGNAELWHQAMHKVKVAIQYPDDTDKVIGCLYGLNTRKGRHETSGRFYCYLGTRRSNAH
ncbi:Uncharacterised protein [Serratia quinivorans]|uniref:Host cell division inhibitory peptide Kil n=1 Tax=Serratia quinivorans TaxID=137545 RepID=A0A379YGC4_9GAMM|nr:Uncharacterised protein [Serratia quinivorans]SUI44205.1 Uncharacterised protein [Serratia quinivorans]